jgi:hypothetical protein
MKAEITVIYLTDNALDERLAEACKRHLLRAIDGKPLITVSQKPINFGDNICVGEIGRCGLNIDKQIRVGLEHVKTPFVAIAEHDCLYNKEHFNWTPPTVEKFYYNRNIWHLQYHSEAHPEHDGMFSRRKRRNPLLLQSQLIAGRDSLLRATEQKIEILSDPKVYKVWPVKPRLGEPGIYSVDRLRQIFKRRGLWHRWADVEKYATECEAVTFKTKLPNVDIRHRNNLTGHRRGYRRRMELTSWGTMEDVLSG